MKAVGDDVKDQLLETAYNLARHHKLEHEGVIWCWNCSKRACLMPSLHCPSCLAESWTRLGIVMPNCCNREQTKEDVERCKS